MVTYRQGPPLYCLRHQTRLEEKLGRAVLVKLFELINLGTITKQHLGKFSYQQNMNVFTTFENKEIKERIEVTMERMLDRWYEDTVCKLSASETLQELLRIVENTCPPVVAVRIKESGAQFSNTRSTEGRSGKGEGKSKP